MSSSSAPTTPSREEIERAQQQAASVCDLPHAPGAGCIKCNGLTTAALNGRLDEATARQERPTIPRSHLIEFDEQGKPLQCNSCEGGVAQHPVGQHTHGARGPDAVPDKEQEVAPTTDKPTIKPFYGVEWAGRTAPDGTQVPQVAVCDWGRPEQPQPQPGPQQ